MSAKKKVLWPIDPTNSDKVFDKNIKAFIEIYSKKVDVEIQPIHVVSADYFLTSEYFEPIDNEALKTNLRADCEKYLEAFSDLPIHSPLILDNHYNARGAEISLFNDYVKSYEPDFVLMASHGRKGWARTFIGSFAESFVLASEVPVILFGPQCEPVRSLSRAIMPVDLSSSTQEFLEKFLDDHRLAFLDKIMLFHKISMVDLEDITWAPTLYGLGSYGSLDILKRAQATTEAFLKSFMDHPLAQKRLDYGISEKLEPVSEVVNKEAQTGQFDLIVMRSEAGTLAASLLGSVTRDILRDATKPLIVYPHLYK